MTDDPRREAETPEQSKARALLVESRKRQAQRKGSVLGRCFAFNYDNARVAFVAGYYVADAKGSRIRVTGDPGTGKLPPDQQVAEYHGTKDTLVWIRPQPVRSEVPVSRLGLDAGTAFSPPAAWLDRSWTLRETEEDPAAAVDAKMRSNGLRKLSKDFLARDESNGLLPKEGWNDVKSAGAHWVLESSEVAPISGGWIGRIELWLSKETLLPTKLKLSLRPMNRVGIMDWHTVLAIFEGYRVTDEVFLGKTQIPHRRVSLTEQQARHLRGTGFNRE